MTQEINKFFNNIFYAWAIKQKMFFSRFDSLLPWERNCFWLAWKIYSIFVQIEKIHCDWSPATNATIDSDPAEVINQFYCFFFYSAISSTLCNKKTHFASGREWCNWVVWFVTVNSIPHSSEWPITVGCWWWYAAIWINSFNIFTTHSFPLDEMKITHRDENNFENFQRFGKLDFLLKWDKKKLFRREMHRGKLN